MQNRSSFDQNNYLNLTYCEASFELAKIAQIEGVNLKKMTREEYADYAI
jgi:hypothetical protein